ncbi:MAG: PfkB family carbohydrate kinase [Pseudomonadota bacterium]
MQSATRPQRVLAVSSQVAYGHVGLSAAVPVLQRLEISVSALPTILLSNHPGWPHVAGRPVGCDDLREMISAIERNGWLAAHDVVLVGYLPSGDHVALAAELIDRLREVNAQVRVVVDPILGDWPKGLYIADAAAQAIRGALVPRADVLTPNLFELGWLSAQPVQTAAEATEAAARLGRRVLVTSAPAGAGRTGVLDVAVTATGQRHSTLFDTALIDDAPNGVGDVFSALIAAGCETEDAVRRLHALICASQGSAHLRIAEAAGAWS